MSQHFKKEGDVFSGTKHYDLTIAADAAVLASMTAEWLLSVADQSQGPFAVALSGGETPKLLYRELVAGRRLGAFPWSRTHWFWGDERLVPPDSPQSNYRMVRENLLELAPIPAANIHPIPTLDLSAEAAAAQYAGELRAYYGQAQLYPSKPLFDVVLLGLGGDGHTASLFPGSLALSEQEAWTAVTQGPDGTRRITLTYPVLASSKNVAFVVAGAGKQTILKRLLAGDVAMPASAISSAGHLLIFADKLAAGGLE